MNFVKSSKKKFWDYYYRKKLYNYYLLLLTVLWVNIYIYCSYLFRDQTDISSISFPIMIPFVYMLPYFLLKDLFAPNYNDSNIFTKISLFVCILSNKIVSGLVLHFTLETAYFTEVFVFILLYNIVTDFHLFAFSRTSNSMAVVNKGAKKGE